MTRWYKEHTLNIVNSFCAAAVDDGWWQRDVWHAWRILNPFPGRDIPGVECSCSWHRSKCTRHMNEILNTTVTCCSMLLLLLLSAVLVAFCSWCVQLLDSWGGGFALQGPRWWWLGSLGMDTNKSNKSNKLNKLNKMNWRYSNAFEYLGMRYSMNGALLCRPRRRPVWGTRWSFAGSGKPWGSSHVEPGPLCQTAVVKMSKYVKML